MEIKSKASPRIKLRCKDMKTMINSLFVNLDEVKIDKKEIIEAEEVNNATAFVNMKIINHALVLSAIPLAASLTSFGNFS